MLRIHHEDSKTRRLDGDTEAIAEEVVDSVFKMHSALGPGLLESVYEICLAHEFARRGLSFERQVSLPVVYEGMRLDAGLRLDMVVEGKVILELKSVESLLPVHRAQMITYLKLSGHKLGFLVNFNVALIKDGIRRIIQ
jgi:GxxExxY protein